VKHGPIEAGDGYVSKRAARERHERERAERQVRDLERECSRLRQIIRDNGIRI
jgi:hypothetical protein